MTGRAKASIGQSADPPVIDRAFGNTVLHNPMSTFMYCILGSKIDSLSNALTWLRDNARITLPTVPDNVLVLSPEAMNEMAGPVTAAAVGGGGGGGGGGGVGDDGGVVGKLIAGWERSIKAERNFYACIVGVWGALAVIGLGVVLWNGGAGERWDSWRAQRKRGGALAGAGVDRVNEGGGAGDGRGQAAQDGRKRVMGVSIPIPFAVGGRPGTDEKMPVYDAYNEKTHAHDGHGHGHVHSHNHPGDPFADTVRPEPDRRPSTALSGLAALVAPGERFLRSDGRKTPVDALAGRDTDQERLVRGGETSEMYSHSHSHPQPYSYSYTHGRHPSRSAPRVVDDDLPTPPPMWIKKASAALARVSPLGAFFPRDACAYARTRGESHGAAIHDGRRGHVRVASGDDEWVEDDAEADATPETPLTASFTPDERERAGTRTSSRAHARANSHDHTSNGEYPYYAPEPVYPQPMSRAATPHTGQGVQVRLVGDHAHAHTHTHANNNNNNSNHNVSGWRGEADPFKDNTLDRVSRAQGRVYGEDEDRDEVDMLEASRGRGETAGDGWGRGNVGEGNTQAQAQQMAMRDDKGRGRNPNPIRNPFADIPRI